MGWMGSHCTAAAIEKKEQIFTLSSFIIIIIIIGIGIIIIIIIIIGIIIIILMLIIFSIIIIVHIIFFRSDCSGLPFWGGCCVQVPSQDHDQDHQHGDHHIPHHQHEDHHHPHHQHEDDRDEQGGPGGRGGGLQ